MKITIIGAGNIGGSMAIGLATSKALPAENITVTARHATSLERFKEFGIRTSTDNVSAVSDADVIFYAVKPWQMEDALMQTAPALDYARQLVVCVSPRRTAHCRASRTSSPTRPSRSARACPSFPRLRLRKRRQPC